MQQLAESEMTWGERLMYQGELKGELKGKREGELQGRRDMLLRLLALRFGILPPPLIEKIQKIADLTTYDVLSEYLLKAATLAEFQAQTAPYLADTPPSSTEPAVTPPTPQVEN